jgi:hypothetical protein
MRQFPETLTDQKPRKSPFSGEWDDQRNHGQVKALFGLIAFFSLKFSSAFPFKRTIGGGAATAPSRRDHSSKVVMAIIT